MGDTPEWTRVMSKKRSPVFSRENKWKAPHFFLNRGPAESKSGPAKSRQYRCIQTPVFMFIRCYSICRSDSNHRHGLKDEQQQQQHGAWRRVFTSLHGTQTGSSDENSVCLSVRSSVRLSNAWVVTKWKKNLSRFLYHIKEHLA